MKLIADYHTHTRHSHGRGSVADNAAAARARGLGAVAITDHGPANIGFGVRDAGVFLRIRGEVEECRQTVPGLSVLSGVEANVISLRGDLDVPSSVVERLDLTLVGLHWPVRPGSRQDAVALVARNAPLVRWHRRVAHRARLDNTKALVEAVCRHEVDIVTHPGLRFPVDIPELARACARRETALEINCGHPYLTVEHVRAAAREGVRFAINSDAHRPQDVGRLDRGLALALRAGLAPDQVINAWPAREVGRKRRLSAEC